MCTENCTLGISLSEAAMAYQIEITPTALDALESINDLRTRAAIIRRIDLLAEEPAKQGNALRAELTRVFQRSSCGTTLQGNFSH
jgi:hypothetical protein